MAKSSVGNIIDEYLAIVAERGGPRTTVQQLQVVRLLIGAWPEGLTAAEIANALNISHETARRHLIHWSKFPDSVSTVPGDDDQREVRYRYNTNSEVSQVFFDWYDGWLVEKK